MLHKLLSLTHIKVFAQTDYVPLVDSLPSAVTDNTNDLAGFLIGWFTVLVGAVTVLAVIWIVLGGIQYMSTDAYSTKSEGKRKITNELIGLLLAGLSWVILYTINPRILDIRVGSPDESAGNNVAEAPGAGSENTQETNTQDEVQGTGSYSSDVTLRVRDRRNPFKFNTEHVKVSGQTVEECLVNILKLESASQTIQSHTPCVESQ